MSAHPQPPESTTRPRREERFVKLLTGVRRAHRDWSNAEHAAWLDLLLACYELDGRFESLEVARAFLGGRAGALDALVARGELIETDSGEWLVAYYAELYDQDGAGSVIARRWTSALSMHPRSWRPVSR